MIPESAPCYLDNYFKTVIGTHTWSYTFSKESRGLDFFSYRFFFWSFGSLLSVNLTQLLVLEKILFHFLAFFGTFLLSEDYLSRSPNSKKDKSALIASYAAGTFYGVNPSFMIGDSFWMGTQFSFAIFPWIVWSFNKVILDKQWSYTFICAFLISLNVDERFLWAGFPIFLVLYSGFIFLLKTFKERKINLHSILSCLLVILIFVGLSSYKLISRFSIISPYKLCLTKAGLDVPWMHASITNMLRAMSHMTLPEIYNTTNPLLSFLNSLMPLTLLITLIAFLSFTKKNFVVLFYGLLFSASILPFFVNSPFKWLHYWIFFNTPFGPAFRTWRIPDAYIALSLSVLIAFSVYNISRRLSQKRHLTPLIIISILLLFSIYSWPLLTGDVNGRLAPIEVPNEYRQMFSFLSNRTDNFRAVYIPEFIYSYGKNAKLKPFWSPEIGAIQEFLIYPSQKPTFWPTRQWGHYYYFTLSPLYYSLLSKGEIHTLAHFLCWANIKYIVIHNDIPSIKTKVEKCINYLNNSSAFKLIFHNNFIYIFENQLLTENKIQVSQNITLIDGGYRVVNKIYNALKDSCPNNHSFIFIDQGVPPALLEKIDTLLTDKSVEQLTADLIFNSILYGHESSSLTFYAYNYVVEHAPKYKWSRASYMDPHQQVWHPYVNWQDYAWDFDYMKGLAFTDNSNDTIRISFNLEKSGEYVIMLRFFANEKGGKIILEIDKKTFEIRTINEYNGFLWYSIFLNLDKGKNSFIIKNGDGFNAISAIAIIPKQDYEILMKKATIYISNKQVQNVAPNLINNSSFENGLNNWKMDDRVMADKKFEIYFDNAVVFSGNYSLKVITNCTKTRYGWSWIRGNWINVKENEKYRLITHIKAENVNSSHIILEGYNESSRRIFQLAQVPSARNGNFDWQIYKYDFVVPENVTKVRVVLNAGWSNQNGTLAITWFDDIKLIPIKSEYIMLNLTNYRSANKLISWTKLDPTKYTVQVNATEPFVLSFAEAYDPLWVCYVNGEKIHSIPLYGVINGFYINQTGYLEITIEYEPQRWFNLGCTIS